MKMIRCVLLTAAFCVSAHAAGSRPLGLTFGITRASHIVEATVESFTEEGFANIRITSELKGKNAPNILKRYTSGCFVYVAKTCLKKGERYIFLIYSDWNHMLLNIPIREIEGKTECFVPEWKKGEYTSVWRSLADVKKHIADEIVKAPAK